MLLIFEKCNHITAVIHKVFIIFGIHLALDLQDAIFPLLFPAHAIIAV